MYVCAGPLARTVIPLQHFFNVNTTTSFGAHLSLIRTDDVEAESWGSRAGLPKTRGTAIPPRRV